MEELRKLYQEVMDDYVQREGPYAHASEDKLHQTALRMIARGVPNAQEIAQFVLRTKELDFDRWFE